MLSLAWVFIKSNNKKWYLVYLANNDVMLLYRMAKDWWVSDTKNRIVFHKEDGSVVVFPGAGHWTLMFQEVKDVEAARKLILSINEKRESEAS